MVDLRRRYGLVNAELTIAGMRALVEKAALVIGDGLKAPGD
jgi:hypothetical protein